VIALAIFLRNSGESLSPGILFTTIASMAERSQVFVFAE
jgi:hypothetical protein